MKYLKDVLVIFAACAISVFFMRACFGSVAIDKGRPLTVLISNEGFGGVGRGTGILLDSTHVLTCAHMFTKPDDTLFVYTYPLGRVVKGQVEASTQELDLAILVLDSSVPVVNPPVFQENWAEGDTVTVIGNALGGMHWFLSKGIMSGEDKGYLLTDALVNPGNSGGPWINDKGEIVALTDWRYGPSEEEHYPGLVGGVGATTIKQFLAVYAIHKALEAVVLGDGDK
jgi:S1-C subfamily serine protease